MSQKNKSINLIRRCSSLFTCSWSAVPPLVEPLDLLSLQRTTSVFYKGDTQPYGCESLYHQRRKNPEYDVHKFVLNALESRVNERAPSAWSRAEANYFIWSHLLTVMSILNSNFFFFLDQMFKVWLQSDSPTFKTVMGWKTSNRCGGHSMHLFKILMFCLGNLKKMFSLMWKSEISLLHELTSFILQTCITLLWFLSQNRVHYPLHVIILLSF